jgi:hypothetical protein
MKIIDPLLEPYSIVIDSDNFAVGIEKEYTNKDGSINIVQQNQTFHYSIEAAIKKIIKHKMADSQEAVDLEQYIKRYKTMIEQFSAKFASLEKLPKDKIEE